MAGRAPSKDSYLSRTSDQALLIFTRNPELGKCKTRLAATIGDHKALAIYTFLLRHTASVTAPLPGTDLHVYFSERLGDGSIWDPGRYRRHLQRGADLGARMQQAFEDAFEQGYTRVVLIGSDLYDLGTKDLILAFAQLEQHPVVFGPASDGGYYLLGLTAMVPALFRNKAWGTSSVLADSIKDLKGESPSLLPERNDVDYYEDIAGHPVFEPFLNDPEHDA